MERNRKVSALIKCEEVGVFHSAAAEQVKRTTDGDIEATMAEIVDFLHIGEHGYAAGIGLRDFSPSTEQGNEFFVDAIA